MNKKFRFSLVTVILTFLVISTALQAQQKPIQISLFNPVQLVNEDKEIVGFRLNLIYGRNTSVTGLDLGLVNRTTSGTSKGVQFGFVGFNDSDFIGFQHSFVSVNKGNTKGLQLGMVNYATQMTGVQIGLVNYCTHMKKGLQIGLVNIIREGGAFGFFPIVNWSF